MADELQRSAAGALIMMQLGEDHGVPAEVSLRGSGITAADLRDPATMITLDQELVMVENVLDRAGDVPGLGLDAGTRFRLSSYGLLGFALLSSPTLRSAVDVAFQFLDLTFAVTRITRRSTDAGWEILLVADHRPPAQRRFLIERDAAGILTIEGDVFATPYTAERVSFTFPPPSDGRLERYAEIFGVVPEFDAAENIIAFTGEGMDDPLPQANELTVTMALDHCRALLQERQDRQGVSGRVRDLLLTGIAAPPDATAVARELHLSDRTLRHKLAEEGTSYRALLDEVRERLAEELLLRSRLPVSEVAQRLGYLEISSFSQAFRRWKGTGPRAYRDAMA